MNENRERGSLKSLQSILK